MSVVVAKKTAKGFVVGCDTIVTHGQVKGNFTKIFRNKKNDDIICGVVGSVRDFNIFSVMDDILDAVAIRREILDTESVISSTIKKIKTTLKEEGRVGATKGDGECMQSSIIIAYKDKCWVIDHDFSVMEVDDFAAIGAPSEFALGAYEVISEDTKMSDKDKAIKVIKACINKTIYVDYPIYIASTEDKSFEKVEK